MYHVKAQLLFPDMKCKPQDIGPLMSSPHRTLHWSTCQNSSKSYCCDPSLWISQCSVCTSWGTWHILSHMKSYYFIYLSNLFYYSKIISYSNLYSLADKEQVFYVPYTKMEEYTIENKYLCNWTKERTEAQGTASQVRISQILTYKYV